MGKRFYILIIFFPAMSFAQATGAGKVMQEGRGLGLATVVISKEAKLVATLLTDSNGYFSTPLIAGWYHLEVSFLGCRPYTADFNFVDSLPTIQLEKESKKLDVVVVETRKPVFERKLDRVIFNVQNSIIASGASIWDALPGAPGVRTAFDGRVTANGKGAVVYMDNRLLRLSGEDLASYLSNLPTDNVLRIEVIANPSASYDAEGGAVIKIVTKKSLNEGFNANVSTGYSQSFYGSYRTAGNFNYRQNKWNVYGNLSNSRAKKAYGGTDYVIFNTPSHTSDWEGDKGGWRSANTWNYKLGVDYSLGKNTVAGIMIDVNNSNKNAWTDIQTSVYNQPARKLDSIFSTLNSNDGRVSQYAFNANFKTRLDTGGNKTLNIDLDFAPFENNRTQDVVFESHLPNGQPLRLPSADFSRSTQRIDISSTKIDYAQKLDENWNAEAGVKWSYITNSSLLDYYQIQNGQPVDDPLRSNKFNYSEKITALYFNSNGRIGKLTLQAGLRGEYTQTDGYSMNKRTVNQYFELFPIVFSSYEFNDHHEVNLYLGRHINRPDYRRLNPFRFYTSPYSFLEGNPDLKPSFTQEAEIGYSFLKKYSAKLFYYRTTQYFSNITIQDNENNLFYDVQRNLDQSLEAGARFSAPCTPAIWWEINPLFIVSYKKEQSGFLNSSYNYSTWFFHTSLYQSFILSKAKGWRAEVNASYASPGLQGIYKLGSSYDVGFGVRKTILKGKGSLQLSMTDIFYSNIYRIKVNYQNQQNGFTQRSDTRALSLGFSYKFDRKKITDARNRKTASEEEKGRAMN